MIWILAGMGYCAIYIGAVTLVGGDVAKRWVGDLGLLLSPLVPVAIVAGRWRAWNGRALIYWATVAVGCVLWVAGHIGWSVFELMRDQPLPWLEWPVALKLTGAVMPMLGLISWPHAQIRGGSLATAVLDIAGVTLLSAFLFWSMVVAPGLTAQTSPAGIESLVVIGSVLHVAIVGSFAVAARAAGRGPWHAVYQRLAIGAAAGSVLLTTNAYPMATGTYTTGSIGDIGWIVPFWCFAWAAWEAPRSPQPEASPVGNWVELSTVSPLLFVPALVPIVGYGPRLLAPLGPPVDRMCDVVTAVTLTGALALTLIRVAVEQRARHRSDYRLWLLATACEQSDDLIVVIRMDAIEYANKAFQRALGYSLDDLRSLPPQELIDRRSRAALRSLVAALRSQGVARSRLTLRRRNGSTFDAACSVTPISSASGRTVYFVGRRARLDRRAAASRPHGAARTAVGDRRSRVGCRARNQQPAAIGDGSGGAGAAGSPRPRCPRVCRSDARRGRSCGANHPWPARVRAPRSLRSGADRSERDGAKGRRSAAPHARTAWHPGRGSVRAHPAQPSSRRATTCSKSCGSWSSTPRKR